MLVKLHAIFPRFVRPPRGDDIQRNAPVTNVVDVCRLLGQQRRIVKRWPHCHHQLKSMCDSRQRRGRGPCIERLWFWALDVIQIELGNQRESKADLLTAAGEPADVCPACFHLLVFNIAQPAAENRKPVSVSHYAASFSRKSTSRTNGSKPTTFGPSATKLESALMS